MRFYSRLALLVFLLGVALAPAHAQLPITLPDAAKPGAQVITPDILYPELEPEPGKYIVPPVVDRPLGVDEGPRIQINAFDLRGVTDRPEQDLMVEDVWKILEQTRATYPDGMTIGELQEMTVDITDYYRQKGFIVAHAFLPVQTVEDGIIIVQVLEGTLGRVMVEDNKRYKPEMIAKPFEEMVGKPLYAQEVEGSLVRLTDYPGLTTFGVFQPGENVGESDLVLKVQEEKGGDMLFSLNNHGSRFTGEYLAKYNLTVNNMFGLADTLDITYQRAFDPSLSEFKALKYSQMLFEPQYRMTIGRDENYFTIADDGATRGTGLVLSGFSRIAYLKMRNDYMRSRLRNEHFEFSIHRKTSKIFQDDKRLARDHLTVLGFEWGFDNVDVEGNGVNMFMAKYDKGVGHWLGAMDEYNDRSSSRRGGSTEFAGANFDKLTLSYTRLQTLSATRTLLFRTLLQYTEDMLVPMEGFSMGGADSVRAYPISEQLTDIGFFLSAEHSWNAPGFEEKPSWFKGYKWGEVFSVSTFFDWAYGERNDPLDSEGTYESLKGWGVGAQLAVPNTVTAKMTAAWPLMDSPYPSNKRKPQFFMSVEAMY